MTLPASKQSSLRLTQNSLRIRPCRCLLIRQSPNSSEMEPELHSTNLNKINVYLAAMPQSCYRYKPQLRSNFPREGWGWVVLKGIKIFDQKEKKSSPVLMQFSFSPTSGEMRGSVSSFWRCRKCCVSRPRAWVTCSLLCHPQTALPCATCLWVPPKAQTWTKVFLKYSLWWGVALKTIWDTTIGQSRGGCPVLVLDSRIEIVRWKDALRTGPKPGLFSFLLFF